MLPKAEFVHWWFATGFLIIGLLLLAEAFVGEAVWRRRPWRVYLWPSFLFGMGVLMWPVMVFYTNSTIHMLAHGSWAQAMMLAGAAELGLARGKLHSPYWSLTTAGAFLVSAAAILLHEQNGWFYARAAFLHHVIGWTFVVGAAFPLPPHPTGSVRSPPRSERGSEKGAWWAAEVLNLRPLACEASALPLS